MQISQLEVSGEISQVGSNVQMLVELSANLCLCTLAARIIDSYHWLHLAPCILKFLIKTSPFSLITYRINVN